MSKRCVTGYFLIGSLTLLCVPLGPSAEPAKDKERKAVDFRLQDPRDQAIVSLSALRKKTRPSLSSSLASNVRSAINSSPS